MATATFMNPWHDEIGRFAPKGTGRMFGASQAEMRSLFEPVRPLVDLLEGAGAKTYLVGGSVRDRLLGIDAKDIDIEVHDMSVEDTIRMLRERGARVDEVGKAFGVLKVTFDGETHDFSFPRTEVKTGEGHTGFDVTVDPNLGIEKALERRDFTMNAMAVDSDGNLLDPFGGADDLRNGIIRHVGPAFAEDPLRVLRGVQFASRLNMRFDPETAELARGLLSELETIHPNRVWGEFAKLGMKGTSMEAAVQALKDVGLDTRYGNVEFNGEPDLEGLDGDIRAAVALTSIGVDKGQIGAPQAVKTAMRDLQRAMAFEGSETDSLAYARRLKDVSFRDAQRIAPINNVDPRVLDGPLPSLIDGNDVMARGIRGPAIGEVLRAVQRAQDADTITTREEALDWLDRNAATAVRHRAAFANPWHDEIGQFAPKGTGKKSDGRVSKAEEAAAKKLAREKARNVPKPTEDDVIQGQVDALLAREGLVRAGGDRRGNNTARKRRAKQLAEEFGDGETCPCADCGQRLAADPETAEDLGIDALTQDKILVGTLGGSYKIENLVPSCPPCNQSRGDREGVGVVGNVRQKWGSPERFTRQVVRDNGTVIAQRFQARRSAIMKRKGISWEEHVAKNPDALPQDWDELRRPVGGNFATVERLYRRFVNGDAAHHELRVDDPVRVDVPGEEFALDGRVVDGVVEVLGVVPPEPLGSDQRAVLKNHRHHRSEFMNPWHDEIGRFAEEGVGTNFAHIASRAREAEAAGSEVTQLDVDSAAELSARLDDFVRRMNDSEFEFDHGVLLTKFALNQRHGKGTMRGFAATDPKGNVLGAIAYTKNSDGHYHIELLGSTGLVKGVGSQLVIPVMEQAAADGAKVSLKVAAGSESAGPFWESMGFERTPSGHTEMLPADVKAWVANIAREREGVLVAAGPPSEGWDPDDDRWAALAIELGLMTPLVASVGEFANPWHDEIGRFAPKGTGTKFDLPKGESFSPESREDVDKMFVILASQLGVESLTPFDPETIKNAKGWDVKVGIEKRVAFHPYDDTTGRPSGDLGNEWPAELHLYDHGRPDADGKWKFEDGSPAFGERKVGSEPIEYVYRAMGESEFNQMLERGYMASDLRGVISQTEGTNAAAEPINALSYVSRSEPSRIVKIRVDPADDWFLISADQYVRTRQNVPLDRIEAVSQRIGHSREGKGSYLLGDDEQDGFTVKRRFTFASPSFEFANPWHDEIGRFAPKGTGSQSDGIPNEAKLTIDNDEADDDFEEQYGNERPSGDGDCFPTAMHYLWNLSDEERKNHRIVHGVPRGQAEIEGLRFDHAWVERTDPLPDNLPPEQREMFERFGMNVIVIDKSNGNNVEMPRVLYYQLGHIDESSVRRYTFDEAAANAVRTGHYGPWT